MATKRIISANSEHNAGIVIPYATGTRVAGDAVSNVAGRTVAASPTIIRTTPKDGTNTDKILSAGTFAAEGGQIIPQVTTTVAGGVAETAFRHVGPSEAGLKPVSNLETGTFRQVPKAIRQGLWNEFSGVFASAPTVAQEDYRRDYGVVPSGGYGVTTARIQTIIGGRTATRQALGPKTQ